MTFDRWQARKQGVVLRLGVALLAATGLSACGDVETTPDQVLVRGDDFEITVQEYDQVLRRSPLVTKEAIGPMRQAVMEGLIGEKLLAEEALKAGLDKQAATAQAIAAAKRSVLAQAYVQKLAGNSFRPDEREVRQYYAAHQAQFGERRRLVLSEYVVRSDLPDVRQYVETLDKRGMGELATALAQAMPSITPVTLVRFSDEIPDTPGRTLQRLQAGDAIVYQTPGHVHLGQVQSVEIDPIALVAARPRIEAGLVAQRQSELVRTTVQALRKTRNVKVTQPSLASGADLAARKDAMQ
ncbi:peptidyl-prolyl cis-trans isomerase [Novosphingobium resinovorum]|uniref:peptidyl-prolyl cis-trans isomerase n=1 Tax=Novosphingobium resinovorum TaxID=158500 RepID=UPI002ECFDE9D